MVDDLEQEIEGLRREGRLADMLLSLTLMGMASLADRVTMTAMLDDRLAHELRYLDLDSDGLIAAPTPEDVAQIDVQGALAGTALFLRARAEGSGPEAPVAAAALERLFIEALRFDARAAR